MSAVSVISYETIKNTAENKAATDEMYKSMAAHKSCLSVKIAQISEEIIKDRKYADPFYSLVSAAVKGEYKDNPRYRNISTCPYTSEDIHSFRWHLGRAVVEFLKNEPNITNTQCFKALGITKWTYYNAVKGFYEKRKVCCKRQNNTAKRTTQETEQAILRTIEQLREQVITRIGRYEDEIKTLKAANASLENELEKHRKLVETMQQLITNLRNELNVEEKEDKKESA
jgi:hypothetical protein